MANALALPALSPEQGLRRYMNEIQKFPMLDADQEYMLAKRWAEKGDYDAAQTLVTSHLRLVAKMASGFKGYGLPVGELISEGNIGLMQAVKKFDPEKGFRLSTYAMWWIKASMQEFVLRSWTMVKVGTSAAQKKLFFNLKRMKKQLEHYDDGTDLTPDMVSEIASELDVKEKDVVDMNRRMIAQDQFLNAPMGKGEEAGGQWMDMLVDESDNQEEAYGEFQEYDQKRSMFLAAMDTLNEREQAIIAARKLAEEPETLEALSKRYNVSRERVRQIEARALEKLTEQVAKQQASEPTLAAMPAA